MKRKSFFVLLFFIELFFWNVSFLFSSSLLVPYGSPAYLPLSFTGKELSSNGITLVTVLKESRVIRKIGRLHPDILLLSPTVLLNPDFPSGDYEIKYIVLWKAGVLLVPSGNPNLSTYYSACPIRARLLKWYVSKVRSNARVKYVPPEVLMNRILSGGDITVLLFEPLASLVLSLMPGRYLPFEVVESFIYEHAGFTFPVKGLPLAAIFVRKGKENEVATVVDSLVGRADLLNDLPGRFAPVISKNFRKFFNKRFSPDIIEDSLQSKRIYFRGIPEKEIHGELNRYLNFFKMIR